MSKCWKCHLRETKFAKFPGGGGMPLDPPLFFNIYMNDINFAGQITSLRLYADDTTTYQYHFLGNLPEP